MSKRDKIRLSETDVYEINTICYYGIIKDAYIANK